MSPTPSLPGLFTLYFINDSEPHAKPRSRVAPSVRKSAGRRQRGREKRKGKHYKEMLRSDVRIGGRTACLIAHLTYMCSSARSRWLPALSGRTGVAVALPIAFTTLPALKQLAEELFDRVASSSNPVDDLSRGDMTGPWTLQELHLPARLLQQLRGLSQSPPQRTLDGPAGKRQRKAPT